MGLAIQMGSLATTPGALLVGCPFFPFGGVYSTAICSLCACFYFLVLLRLTTSLVRHTGINGSSRRGALGMSLMGYERNWDNGSTLHFFLLFLRKSLHAKLVLR